MDTFKYICPFCGAKLECDESSEGIPTTCPSCEHGIVPSSKTLKNKVNTTSKSKEGNTNNARGSYYSESFENDNCIFPNFSKGFKRPLLADIFCFLGYLEFFSALVIIVIEILNSSQGEACWGWKCAVWSIALILDAFINLGIAQLIYFIGRICFNSCKIWEFLSSKK